MFPKLQEIGKPIRTTKAYAPLIVASALLALMLIPGQIWHQPANDALYHGFDPNLLYINETGYGASKGTIAVFPNLISITTQPSSQPTIHLVTSTLSFNATIDVIILRNGQLTLPLELGIWTPRGGSGFYVDFGSPPWNYVRTRTVIYGSPAMTLIGGLEIQNQTLGQYSINQTYHIMLSVDKRAGVIQTQLSTIEGSPTGSPMLKLVGGPSRLNYSDVFSEIVPVTAGTGYDFGGLVKMQPGSSSYKTAIQWLDNSYNHISFSGNWSDAEAIQGWTNLKLNATAPANATYARLLLGSGDGSTAFFANLFLANTLRQNVNLLSNGDFRGGATGWLNLNQSAYLQLLNPFQVTWHAFVTADEAPQLLNSLRLSLTTFSSSQKGTANVVLQNYSLIIPHQIWQVDQIDDVLATLLLDIFLILGLLLTATGAASSIHIWVGPEGVRHIEGRFKEKLRAFFDSHRRLLTIWMLLTAIFLFINAYLFTLGSHPFDMTAQEIWAYVAVRYNPLALYQLPNTVTLARVWAGTPYHEAIFPYEPFMAYIFMAGGLLFRFFSGSSGFVIESGVLEVLIKSINAVFTLGDGAVIYLVMRKLNLSQRQSLVGSGLFIFNPAVLFSAAVWGATLVISLFFVLASILLAENRRLFGAWLFLFLACLTRPQMLVPGFLIGLLFLRKFRSRENAVAFARSVIIVFLLISPFLAGISPSVPKDIVTNTLAVQETGGNEPALNTVSLDAYSIWPLVTYISGGARGLSRIFYESTSTLIGPFSYERVGLLLTLGVILGVSVLIMLHRKTRLSSDNYLLAITLGMVGFLLFETGLAATHYVLGLPFLILCKKSLNRIAYYSSIGIWTVTTLVPMYGSLGYAVTNVGYLAPAIQRSAITRYFMGVYASDSFITIGIVANLLVFACLTLGTWSRLRGKVP